MTSVPKPPPTPTETILAKIQKDIAAIRWHASLMSFVIVAWAIIAAINGMNAIAYPRPPATIQYVQPMW